MCPCDRSELFAKVRQDVDQLRAAELIARQPVVVMSGKGGCGKTEVVSAVVSYAIAQIDTEKYVLIKDVLFLVTRLVAYWPAPIHAVAHANLYCRHMTSGRLAVCYSQIRSIISSATAFPAATLR